ncbi:hypothetical protein DFH06DRAFT_1252913 [Mycena polygramma]|nr:hypothetical protein DFH06DRAFT_1252913 [Mycena polygramma]
MPPTKRQRTDGDSSNLDNVKIVQSDIWFEDGNIILQAENTHFRVYKGTLCSSSQVLKDAIEDIEDSKGVEGCSFLMLSDSSFDVTYVLRTIFHPWSYPENAPWPFAAIAAFLRLGRKYQMKPLYDIALSRLAIVYPSSVLDYPAHTMNKYILFSDPASSNRRQEIVIDSIVLARELGLLALLPAAFWYFSTHVESLGYRDISRISQADRGILFSAVAPLRVAYADYLFGWLDETLVNTSPNCALPESCGLTKVQHSLRLWKPPGIPMSFAWNSGAELGLCRYCVAVGKKHHSDGVKRLWKELPSFFGLPPWEELLAGAPNA